MRQDWEKKTFQILPEQDLSNYNLDTTNGFKIGTPSTSTSTMSRMVNLIPYKDKNSFKFKKRPGCVSETSLGNSDVFDAILSTTNVLYIGGLASGAGGDQSLKASINGTTWVDHIGPAFTSGGHTVSQGLSGLKVDYLSETSISNTTYIIFPVNVALSSPPISGDSTAAYYLNETDVTALTKGPVTGTCSVTSGSAVVTAISSTTKFAAGQMINFTTTINGGTGDGTTVVRRILTVDSGTQITLNTTLDFDTGGAIFTKGSVYKITDTDFPANATPALAIIGRLVSLNGYIYVLTVSGSIYNSDINSITSWTATSNIATQMSPDYGRTLMVYKNMILAFGEKSIEFFRDVGNSTGSPLQSVPELFIKLGIRSAKHVASVEDTLVFMSNTDTGANSIYILDGYNPRKISTDDLDYVISLLGPTNFELKAMRLNGKLCILVNRVNTTSSQLFTTFVYYPEDDVWGEWKVTETGTVADYTHPWQFPMGYIGTTFYSVSDFQTTNGVYVSKFLTESDNNFYDNLSASTKNVTAFIQTKRLALDTLNRKFLKELRIADTTSTGFNPGTSLTVYWSDDFGQTWTSRAFASTKQFLSNLGQFRERIFRFVESSNDFYQFNLIELLYKLGQH